MSNNYEFKKYKEEILEMYRKAGARVDNITLLENGEYRLEYLDGADKLVYFYRTKEDLDYSLELFSKETILNPDVPRYGRSPQPIS